MNDTNDHETSFAVELRSLLNKGKLSDEIGDRLLSRFLHSCWEEFADAVNELVSADEDESE